MSALTLTAQQISAITAQAISVSRVLTDQLCHVLNRFPPSIQVITRRGGMDTPESQKWANVPPRAMLWRWLE
ncbi:hypothetical protein Acor_05600 [Acrocarpospora corrugata]|uniref:Uncharacterized protein n=1 Tax=Acrocarpospora corrugata TaxID=35763 RepID=A0A5M3VQL8_9ACTN|nr:hypothetical protein Acor_05600 [Acrocarpospora corrugata]